VSGWLMGRNAIMQSTEDPQPVSGRGRVVWLGWDDVMKLCTDLARTIQREYDPDVVVGIAHAGVIPAAIIASMLRVEFDPIRLTRRSGQRIVRSRPKLVVPLTDDVSKKRVLIVDEMSITGETLRLAAKEADRKGARKVKTAALYVRSGTWQPNWYGMRTDDLVVEPWDERVIVDGELVLHPECEAAMDALNTGL